MPPTRSLRRRRAATRTDAWATAPYGKARVALVATKPLVRLVRRGLPLVERIVAPAAVQLPVRRGEALGCVEIWRGKKLVGSRPLRAARAVAKPGAASRLGWYAGRTMHHL